MFNKLLLLVFSVGLLSSELYSQCTWPVISTESYEYTTVIPDLIAGTTYQNTPQTYAGCVRTGSRGMYLNIVDGFQGLLYSRTYTVCVGQTYRFSFSTRDAFSSSNNLTFNVYSSANVLLATQTVINGSTWNDITMASFVAPTTAIRFEIVTNIPGASGNDAGFDDLKLASCNTPNAGADNSASYCGPGSIIDLDNFLSSTANTGGTWAETTTPPSGMFNTSNANWATGDLAPGTYTFRYTVGPGTCTDFANFTITLGNIAAVNLGPDINLCTGQTTTLNAGAGYQSYLWNTGATSQTLNVTTAGTYHVRVGTLGANVITNGDFEAGNTGFTTQYTVGTGGTWGPVSNPGTYLVTTNPNTAHSNFTSCTDHTAAPGTKQMVVNGSSTAGTQVWCQTIPIQPATTYEFGCWVSTAVSDPAVAQLQFSINSAALGAVFSPPSTSCNWNQFTQNWFSGTTTTANICIVNQNTAGSGNDFSLDDITFKPQCYSYDTVVVNYFAVPTVNAGADQTVCAGTNVTLSATSTPATAVVSWNNGVTNGVAFPAPASTTTYTATATNGGICTATDQVTVTVSPNVTPTFTAVGPFCAGDAIAALPTTSNNGITGLWTPAINNMATTTYTFTPTAGLCATTVQMTITINNPVTPTFTAVGPFCQGDAISALPTTSTNGYNGLWTPSINNTATTTYTFTPTAGQCATTAQMTITINNPVTPTFTAVGPFCEGDAIAPLPTPSTNGYNGLWTPAINNMATTTYTFTPTAGQCATTAQMTITVNTPVTPTFTPVGPFCEGSTIAALPTTSNNGYNGLWTPAINNMATTTYTFTPAAGQCATTAQMTITITVPTVPTFTAVGPFCQGDVIAPLPTTSNNSITGLWTPAIDNTVTTTYTFTPTAGVCATTAQMTIVINPPTTPTFDPIPPLCVGDPAPALQTPSNEGDTGTWTPATVSTAAAGTNTFTFHPTAGTCVTTAMISVTVGPPAVPTFSPVGPFCAGDAIAPLPSPSNNSVPGVWTPAINNTATTTYLFTPSSGICATTTNLTITINQPVTPAFTPVGPYCVSEAIPALPTTSNDGITGLWSPGTINNTATTAYTFTPDPGQCATTATLTIIINPATVPTFTPPAPICEGGTAPVLPTTSNNSFTGT